MTKNQILELFLTSLYETQYDICTALGLERKHQPRVSRAFKGEKHSFRLIVRLCEEKRLLTEGFLESMEQRFEKNADKQITLQERLIEKQREYNKLASLFQRHLSSKGTENDLNRPQHA